MIFTRFSHQMPRLILFLLLFIPTLLFSQSTLYDVKDYGATGRKSDLATSAIQAAIDACASAGGGTVLLPPGDYRSGTLVLKDNIDFHLTAGATLFASHEAADYDTVHLDFFKNPVLLYAKGVSYMSMSGKGKINGEAKREYRDLERVDRFIAEETEIAKEAGVEMKMYYKVAPITAMVFFSECENITITDLSFIESTFWTLHIEKSKRIWIRGIYVYSDLEKGVNSDGIDISNCQDVTISDCIVETGDDGICIKTRHRDFPCENITVTNCIVTSSSTALKLGTESYSDFRHIIFSNCVVRNSNRGLSIVIRDGGTAADVLFSNITIDCSRRHFNWWGDADPIWLVVTKRAGTSKEGYIDGVVFDNIKATGRGTSRIESRLGRHIRNITLRDVQLHMLPEDAPDKRAGHAFEVFQVDDLTLENVRVTWDEEAPEPKWASALFLKEVRDLELLRFHGRQGLIGADAPVVQLHNVSQAVIRHCEAAPDANTLFRFEGAGTQGIYLDKNMSRTYNIPIWEAGADVDEGEGGEIYEAN